MTIIPNNNTPIVNTKTYQSDLVETCNLYQNMVTNYLTKNLNHTKNTLARTIVGWIIQGNSFTKALTQIHKQLVNMSQLQQENFVIVTLG